MNPFAYLLRRELWEHRALYVVPAVVALLVLLGAMFGDFEIPVRVDPGEELASLLRFSLIGLVALFVFVMTIVTAFYLLDALYADRRDRSILFWKSMPVSDTQIVLSKFAIAMLVVPAIVLAGAVLTLLGALVIGSLRSLLGGGPVLALWSQVAFVDALPASAYGLAVQLLWYAPLYAWLLLVSAWARRAVFLWATVTPLAVILAEWQIFDTTYFASLLRERLIGVYQRHLAFSDHHSHADMTVQQLIDPRPFLTDPGLYLGLLAAALLLGGAVWLRRYRDET